MQHCGSGVITSCTFIDTSSRKSEGDTLNNRVPPVKCATESSCSANASAPVICRAVQVAGICAASVVLSLVLHSRIVARVVVDAKPVLDVLYAADALGDVLGPTFFIPAVHRA